MDQSLIDQLQSNDPAQRQRAIMVLGRTGDRTALPALAALYKNDPVPELRQLAGRAGRAIMQREPETTPAAPPTIESEQPPPKKAAYLFNAALESHIRGENTLALEKLVQAFQAHPAFAQDTSFRALAGELMDAEPDEAIQRLSDKSERRTITKEATKTRQQIKQTSKKRHPIRLVLLAFSTTALIIQLWWFTTSGMMDQTILLYRIWQARRDIHQLPNGQEYYVFVPSGSTPKNGWPVLVVMHGYGGSGENMLIPELMDVAQDEKAILIAPTFGDYGGASTQNNAALKRNLDAILTAVAKDHRVNEQGAVLYGFSQGGQFATSFLTGYSHRIAAIVTDGAPDIILPPVGTYLRPCHFVYGANDGLQNFTQPNADRLRSLGFEVTFEIVPGVGHQMTATALNWVREMIRNLH